MVAPRSAQRAASHPKTPAQIARDAAKSKFTPEVRSKILSALRTTCTITTACAFARITTETYYQWMKRGVAAKPGDPYRTFYEEVTAVLSTTEVHFAAIVTRCCTGTPAVMSPDGKTVVTKAVPADGNLALKLLGTRFGTTWQQRQKMELTDGGTSSTQAESSFDDTARDLQRVLAASAARARK